MAQHALSSNVSASLTSFSAKDRFSYSAASGFRVAIPRVGHWDYHTRAKLPELKALLIADVKLTRGGKISKHQPERPFPGGDYRCLIASSKTFTTYLHLHSWFLAQLIHYGLELQFTRDQAKAALKHALLTAQIEVPGRLLQLESDMRKSYDQRVNSKRRTKQARPETTAVRTVAAIYSTLSVTSAPQRAGNGSDISDDGSEDSDGENDEQEEANDRTSSTGPSGTTHSVEEGRKEFEPDNKPEPAKFKATFAAASKTVSSPDSSSDESPTHGDSLTHNRLPPPKFTLPKPAPPLSIRPIKSEVIERHDIGLKDPFIDPVRSRAPKVGSRRANVAGPHLLPPKSVKGLDYGDANHNRKMTREEYLQMRENLAGPRDCGQAKKRPCQVTDESAILDEAQEFLNSASRWQDEHQMGQKPESLSQNKRLKFSSKPPAEPKVSSTSKYNVQAGLHESSSPPTPLDRALDRVLATQSRIDAAKVEKQKKQRVVGLSRQSGGGLLQSLAHESNGTVGRDGKERSALAAARLAE